MVYRTALDPESRSFTLGHLQHGFLGYKTEDFLQKLKSLGKEEKEFNRLNLNTGSD